MSADSQRVHSRQPRTAQLHCTHFTHVRLCTCKCTHTRTHARKCTCIALPNLRRISATSICCFVGEMPGSPSPHARKFHACLAYCVTTTNSLHTASDSRQQICFSYFAVQDPEEPIYAAVCQPPPPAQKARLHKTKHS